MWPTVERERQLHRACSALARGESVLFLGGAGVGRTTLLGSAARASATGELDVVRVPALAFPGNALADLPGEGDETRRVLVIDDAHLMDSLSAALLHHAVGTRSVSLLATVRTGGPMPEWVSKLWVQRLAERIDVPALSGCAVVDLLHEWLGGDLDAESARRLWQLTGGNPLLLRELMEDSLSQGRLCCSGERWTWQGLGQPTDRLIDAVWLYVGIVTDDEAELLRMVALAGSLNADLPTVAALTAVAERLSGRGVLVATATSQGVRLRFAVPLCAEVLVATMPELTRWRLRHLLAEDLEHTSADEDMVRAALLRCETGRLPAADRLLEAAAVALRREDFRSAEPLCRSAVHAGADPTRLRPAWLWGRALAGQHRHDEAEAVFRACAPVSDDGDSCRLIESRAVNLAWGLQRVDEAMQLLDAALDSVAGDGTHRLRATRSVLWILDDRLDELVAEGHRLLHAESRESSSVQLVVPAAVLACLELGDPVGAGELLVRCGSTPAGWESETELSHRMMAAAVTCALHGPDVALAEMPCDTPSGDGHPMGRSAVLRARLLRAAGRLDEAIALLRTAADTCGAVDLFTTRAWTLAQLAGALAEMGHHAEALRVLDRAHSEQESMPPFPIAANGVAMETALVRAHVGDRSRARREALALARRCAETRRPAQELAALHLAGRLGVARQVAGRARELAAASSSRWMRVQADHLRALSDRDAGALARVTAELAECGFAPMAAEAGAQADALYREHVRHRPHRAAVWACRQFLVGYEGRIPDWVRDDTRDRSGLTARELQIAALAADGRTNRDIAERFVVSVRTVENHLQRVYTKLGITSRAELSDHLDPVLVSA